MCKNTSALSGEAKANVDTALRNKFDIDGLNVVIFIFERGVSYANNRSKCYGFCKNDVEKLI